MRKFTMLLIFILMFSLAACGGGGDSGDSGGPGGSVEAGKSLFNEKVIGSQAGCVTCHSLEEGVVLIGPSLAQIGAEAGDRVSGQSAEEYLRTSIVEPDQYVVEGFSAGSMPAALSEELSDEQVDNLVAFMMTLK